MRKIIACTLGTLALLLLGGCSQWKMPTLKMPTMAPAEPTPVQHYFLDPSIELANYHTYGFLQVTAVRYQEPAAPGQRKVPSMGLFGTEDEKRPDIHHTDELIWRTLQAKMVNKGYSQVAPEQADLWVIYYGGPRPIALGSQIRIKPNAFDEYFARNELKEHSFFVDIIDAKEGKLIYRGWDNSTFSQRNPDADKVINTTEGSVEFFPSRRL